VSSPSSIGSVPYPPNLCVHLFITGNPTLSPNKIIQQVKGYTSRNLREEFDFGLPSLWTRSYFVSSTGEVSSQTIEEYIEAQTGR
jgi:putative transposase